MLQKHNRTWHNHETQPSRGIKRRSDEKQIMTKQSLMPHKYKFGLHRDSLPHLSNIKKKHIYQKHMMQSAQWRSEARTNHKYGHDSSLLWVEKDA